MSKKNQRNILIIKLFPIIIYFFRPYFSLQYKKVHKIELYILFTIVSNYIFLFSDVINILLQFYRLLSSKNYIIIFLGCHKIEKNQNKCIKNGKFCRILWLV